MIHKKKESKKIQSSKKTKKSEHEIQLLNQFDLEKDLDEAFNKSFSESEEDQSPKRVTKFDDEDSQFDNSKNSQTPKDDDSYSYEESDNEDSNDESIEEDSC